MKKNNTVTDTGGRWPGTPSFAPPDEVSMRDMRFTDEELLLIVERVDKTPQWRSWERVGGESGRDLVTIHPNASGAAPIRLAKSENGAYMATGFGEWGLTVGASLAELLDVLGPDTAIVV